MNVWQIHARTWLRRVGVLSLMGRLRAQFTLNQRKKIRQMYEKQKPTHLKLSAGGHEVLLGIKDANEYEGFYSRLDDESAVLDSLLESLEPGDCCWDVGANMGVYSLVLAKAVGEKGKVYAFEPEERSFKRLSQNIELNHLTNIQPVKLALGDRAFTSKMELSEHAGEGTHRLVGDQNSSGNYQTVEVQTGDNLVSQRQVEVPKFVKVDVEGWEEEVLTGIQKVLSEPKCRAIFFEVHFSVLASRGKKLAPVRMQEKLKNLGFTTLRWIDSSHLLALKTTPA